MPVPPKIDLRRLASLLDDEDEDTAVGALAELLNRETELGDLPGELQESADPLIRRRAHQLQAALTLIRRRRAFRKLLDAGKIDPVEGLLQIHLQWFDNDSAPRLRRQWETFAARLRKRGTETLERAAGAMRREGMRAESESTLKIENYCLGTILNDRIGAGSILSLLCRELVPDGSGIRLVRFSEEFGLYDGGGTVLIPARNWRKLEASGVGAMEFWEPRSLLQYAMTNLFSAAVNSDAFRYVLTVAQALTGSDSDEPLTVLPYPYNPDLEIPEDKVEK